MKTLLCIIHSPSNNTSLIEQKVSEKLNSDNNWVSIKNNRLIKVSEKEIKIGCKIIIDILEKYE